ncbi:putative aspartic proteinase GIP2 [Apium graveolens]|uniref:putative aspartic proteinase GIP2 n=1 Tax=Apium graveolens TaxID=4045 RepID=UPI003D7A2BC4
MFGPSYHLIYTPYFTICTTCLYIFANISLPFQHSTFSHLHQFGPLYRLLSRFHNPFYISVFPIFQNLYLTMASFIFYHLLFHLLILFLLVTNSEAQPNKQKRSSLVFPIRKDSRTLHYYTTLKVSTEDNHVKVVMDLSGQFTWFNCDIYNLSTYRPIICGSKKCTSAKSEGCMLGCTECKSCNFPSKPGCTNNTCSIDSYNPFTNYLSDQGLGEDTFFADSTNGLTISLNHKSPRPFQFSCANPIQLRKLPAGTKGMTGLANYTISLHTQLSALYELPHKFALCMPSTTNKIPGQMFIGGGPYIFPPYSRDIAEELISTPLVINRQSTAPLYALGEPSKEYFIDVKSIAVDGKRVVDFNSSLLSINEVGDGGTKFTSIFPYTYLETSIYKALVSDFTKAAALRKMKTVASVAPFGACFSLKSIAKSQTGPVVPLIDLMLPDNQQWRFYGGNSMVSVNEEVLCLAFVDAGYKSNPKTSIGIGGYQLENYLIEFDLDSSNVRISPSLLLVNTTCSQSRLMH